MTFIPIGRQQIREVPKKIMVVGDCPDSAAFGIQKAIAGAVETVYEQSLHMAGLTKGDVNFVNLIPDRMKQKNDVPRDVWIDSQHVNKRRLTELGQNYVKDFMPLLEEFNPSVIVPVGGPATFAFLNRADITDIRGYPFQLGNRIVIPSLHPCEMVWTNYIWRFYLANDLRRARNFAEGTYKIEEPKLITPTTFQEACAILSSMLTLKPVSVDIEVSNYEVSCIGFSNESDLGFSIPFDERWTEEEEVTLWGAVAVILQDPTIPKIFQNAVFDVHFLAYKNGILCRGVIEDTMIAHSIAYPDFLKGLGFLGGIHTTYTYWKDQMDYRKLIKKEA